MAGLPRLTGKELASIVLKLGFVLARTRGSHTTFKHPDGRLVTIPQHAAAELGRGLLLSIIKNDLGLTREEFMAIANAMR